MPSHVSQLVTLLAFTAHAVLGCCGHHAHAGHADACRAQASVAHNADCSGHCEHAAGAANHAAGQTHRAHATCCAPSEQTTASDSLIAPAGGAAWWAQRSLPCKDAHECGGGRCAYLNATSQEASSRSAAEPLVLTLQVERGESLLDRATSGFAPGHRPCTRQLSSADCCALLQSWQI